MGWGNNELCFLKRAGGGPAGTAPRATRSLKKRGEQKRIESALPRRTPRTSRGRIDARVAPVIPGA